MDSLTSYLPPGQGLLPKWLFLISVVSMGNSIQAYTTLHFTQQVYAGNARTPTSKVASPVTPLSSRTFATWTMLTGIVRLYAAYNISDKSWYDLAMWTFAVAGFHFCTEWLVFGTARWNRGLAGPVVVFTASLPWMWLQKEYYVGK